MGFVQFVVACLFFIGCATTAKYELRLQAWIGRDANDLVEHWGYPDRAVTAPNGNRVYVFEDAALWQTPLIVSPSYSTITQYGNRMYITTHGGYVDGGDLVFSRCTTYFEVDADQKIVRSKFKGNACKSR